MKLNRYYEVNLLINQDGGNKISNFGSSKLFMVYRTTIVVYVTCRKDCKNNQYISFNRKQKINVLLIHIIKYYRFKS